MADNNEAPGMIESEVQPDTSKPPQPGNPVSVGIRLQAVEHSEQPIFSNFTAVQAGSGVVFVDFGFLEPQAMAALAQLGRPGAKVPEMVGGKLACRMALSLETTANLANQLNQLLRSAGAARTQQVQPAAAETVPPDVSIQ